MCETSKSQQLHVPAQNVLKEFTWISRFKKLCSWTSWPLPPLPPPPPTLSTPFSPSLQLPLNAGLLEALHLRPAALWGDPEHTKQLHGQVEATRQCVLQRLWDRRRRREQCPETRIRQAAYTHKNTLNQRRYSVKHTTAKHRVCALHIKQHCTWHDHFLKNLPKILPNM